jgi:ubiquinone/menaquinone biosynthesis C-methylase UbiE
MTHDFWNARYAEPGFAYGTEPNAFLVSQKHYLKPGMKTLAVADGEGRNGVWLAQQGLDVLSVDGSEVGLRKAQELARSRGDLTTWKWPEQEFDLVVVIFIHFMPEFRVRMHRQMLRALKPGGVLIMEAFTPKQLEYKTGGPPVKEMLYRADMLREEFRECEILRLEEILTGLNEGPYHRGTAAVVRLIVKHHPALQRE